ncbi:MAG: hypothetical protein ACOY45_04260 [Pseudomonadota bacterium]
MNIRIPVEAPGRVVPLSALSFASGEGDAVAVGAGAPLPVRAVPGPSTSTPLAGTMDQSGQSTYFAPELERPIWLHLQGAWSGRVTLLRAADVNDEPQPVTIGGVGMEWTMPIQEAVAVESAAGAVYCLEFTHFDGELSYRVSQ